MKTEIPPRIYWHIEGEVSESEQKRIRAEARRQVGLLNEGMKFQGLNQGKRRAEVGGLEFACTSVFGLESIHVSMAGGAPGIPRPGKFDCWCTTQFAEGFISYEIESAPFDDQDACVAAVGVDYPFCALDKIGDYAGIRYAVSVCQKKKFKIYICMTSDFKQYAEGDSVVVMYTSENGNCGADGNACAAEARSKLNDLVVDGVDGVFVIMPYSILPIV